MLRRMIAIGCLLLVGLVVGRMAGAFRQPVIADETPTATLGDLQDDDLPQPASRRLPRPVPATSEDPVTFEDEVQSAVAVPPRTTLSDINDEATPDEIIETEIRGRGVDSTVQQAPRQEVEHLATSLREAMNRNATTGPTDNAERELKTALDRYFAQKELTRAIEYLEGLSSRLEGSPEANAIRSAIQVLRQSQPGTTGPAVSSKGKEPVKAPVDPLDENAFEIQR